MNTKNQRQAHDNGPTECQIFSLENGTANANMVTNQRPNTSSGRKGGKNREKSEFRRYFDEEELPLTIEVNTHVDA